MREVIDFHCHLDLYEKPFEIAAECRAQGVYVLSVTTTPSAWKTSSTLSVGEDRIRVALGLHPQIAHERVSELALFDELLGQTKYVGEIGLDGDRDFKQHWEKQLLVFDHILESCAKAGGRILSIHSRKAVRHVLERLACKPTAGVPVLHWFSGTPNELDSAIEAGCWFSVGPAMLRGKKGSALAARIPRDKILTETDGPFARTDGVPLLPWQVNDAERRIAEIWRASLEEVQHVLHRNLRMLVASV